MARKYRNIKKRRNRRIIRILSFVLILLLFVLGRLVFKEWKEKSVSDPESSSVDESVDKPLDLSIQLPTDNVVSDGDSSAVETDTQDYQNKDIQRQENTATEEHHKTNGLAICMYHYIYDKNDPPKEELNANYIEVHALEEEFQYLKDNNYYFPTWEEVEKYVKGELLLPEKSVVLTFDDGAKSFLKYGPELCEKYEIPITSFLIGKNDGENKVKKHANDYLTFQSHSYDMHRAGGNIGHGGIFPVMPHDDAVADLRKSTEVCGNGDAFAYPYGDYNDSCIQAVRDAGFLCAVTTEYGRANPGDDPLLLPRVRMSHQQSLESFIKLVE